MIITKLTLKNFRNYKMAEFNFDKVNIIFGNNSIGKTNLLEAIYFLSQASPFRLRYQKDLINKKSTTSRIEGDILTKDRKLTLSAFLEIKDSISCEKKLIINKKIKKSNEFVGNLKTIYFLPADISLIDSSPADKRDYFDHLLNQIEPLYSKASAELEKIVYSRNKVLEAIKIKKAKEQELLFWDKELISKSLYVFYKRNQVIDFINQIINKIYQNLTLTNNTLSILYRPSLESLKKFSKKEAEKIYKEKLARLRKKEIEKACSLLGPHRDDYIFRINNQDLFSFGSRSEFREATLALKLSEGKLIEKVTSEKPIFLLDDICSELDDKNKIYLFNFLEKYISSDSQVFITTTALSQINKKFLEKAKIFKIEKGKPCLLN